ncbi:type I-C CRISPR-associated protein Cas8c/Csd1 [Desulfobulbus alkaliphilus]|uniref:type I-C CRISPR-associated protein Cas8c/Csd1 n=1 Tax=Desulfobulbus alkaliphilus TaxID=869814 RepID=UPI00196460CD|nr:type I-C CRISPR-associated protein Cas8c/Csd1 [Desulfobulbus alkaliphilus]MBM9537324.1 type I-C CRISPR-associated protein Cas8c/Csd1 [Desulfobulbus alkaliphilus]
MLLKHFYDYAQSRNLLADLAFAPKAVRWIIDLDTVGNCLGVVEVGDGKRGQDYSCPQTTRNKNAGGVAEFLADGITAIFNCDTDPVPKKKRTENQEKDRQKNNLIKHEDFWEQVEVAATETKHPGLLALRTFCQKLAVSDAPILQFGKPTGAKADAKSAWLLRVSGEEKKLGAENFTFRVDGELLIENSTIRDWWRAQYTAEVNTARRNTTRGLCMVTGYLNQPIALTHTPKIEGVPNTSFGATIVSFDKDAFTSYGFDQSLNAPTSDEAATAYCTALNHMIEKEETSLRIGQTIFCFWAVQNKAAGGRFAQLLNKPDPQSVRSFLVSPWAGIARDLAKKDTFLAVTLAGNKGRVVVRHWLQQSLEQAIGNFQKWFADLEIHVPPKTQTAKKPINVDKQTECNPLSVYWLANTTVRETKDLPPEFPTQLYRAALENTAPSPLLIKPILAQLQSRLLRDENYSLIYDQSRFALLKLIVNRNRKETDMEIKPQLAADTDDPAYNCGRLLSVLSETQKKAQGYPKGFSGVAERYFGTASVSPATVLPLLLRLNRHHLDKIRKSGGNAYEEVVIRNIVAKFKPTNDTTPPVFPRILNLQEQGRFVLGFYQQQAEDANARIAFKVLMYLEETDTTAHAKALALQENDTKTFYEKVSQHYGSGSFKDWIDKKQKMAKSPSLANVSTLFDNE